MQEGRPLDFTRKQLYERNLRKYIYENEMMDILRDMEKLHPYLLEKCFHVKTNHCSLKYFLEKQKWVTKIFGYDYEILYKKRKENTI
jgi:hypothetical protein